MIDSLYYGDSHCHCGHHHFRNVDGAVRFNADILAQFVKKIYRGFDTENSIEGVMWREVLRVINEGTVEGLAKAKTPPTHEEEFYKALRHSNEVFAAFKVHTMGQEMAAKLYDSKGQLKPFSKWVEDVSAISSHQVGAWLRTEYDTAVIRAHAAADWREFERNKDIMPNLRWMPTTSKEPEAVHSEYWRRKLTLSVDDPFWNEHHPGDRWNCKCSLEATDDPVVRLDDMEPTQPQRGLENNPGKDGHIFNDTHPYFPDKCSHCFAKKGGFKNKLKDFFLNANQVKDCHNCKFIDECIPGTEKLRNAVAANIKAVKQSINQYEGAKFSGKNLATGSLTLLRRSFVDIVEHAREDVNLMKWMKGFSFPKFKEEIKTWKYEGWAPNRPYDKDNPHYDPKNPNKRKHPETEHFFYYSFQIDGKTYWANVKNHKYMNTEVLYTIEKEKPRDLIEGKK